MSLLGHVDDAHAPLADRFQELVGADDRTRGHKQRRIAPGHGRDRRFEEIADFLVGNQEGVDSRSEGSVAVARQVQVGSSFHLGRAVQRLPEDRFEFGAGRGHRALLGISQMLTSIGSFPLISALSAPSYAKILEILFAGTLGVQSSLWSRS